MANIAGIESGATFSNKEEIIEVTYDFSVDAGAVGVLNLMLASEDLVIVDAYAKVITTCTSGGSATLICGVAGGDTDACIASTAVASLTAGAVIMGVDATMPVKLASGGYLAMEIGTAAFTAGKIKFVFKVAQFA